MKRFLRSKIVLTLVAMVLIATIVSLPLVVSTASSLAAAPFGLVTLPDSVPTKVAQAQLKGPHPSRAMVPALLLLSPSNTTQMDNLFQEQYNPHSSLYHHWLQKGQFDTLYGPTISQLGQVKSFLSQAGLQIMPAQSDALLLAVTGTTAQLTAAFHTAINDYQLPDGTLFYANASDAQIPTSLNGIISGVVLTDAPTATPLSLPAKKSQLATPHTASSCTYGPAGGFTPCQIQSIYDATPVYNTLHEQGQGITIALFELSKYKRSDIKAYEKQFGLPNVTFTDKQAFSCLLILCDHSGAGEVELDIEMAIALAPGVSSILVYNAPNAFGLVEYKRIANDDAAQVVSTSWGSCESSLLPGEAKLESWVFKQMAMQGQSMLAASGDHGAFDCLGNSSHSPNTLQVDDPASQQNVTAVGGTSFAGATFDSNWDYPTGQEAIWNNNCTPKTCYSPNGSGAGGGVSRKWGIPTYQTGAGVIESGYSKYGSWCGQPSGRACREVPDVSMNADPNSGYAVYCSDTGDADCTSSGWIALGGTSAAAPLWGAITALMDNYSFGGGLLNSLLYSYDSTAGYCAQFHDITVPGSNGKYPTGSDYDMATGIGTPDIYYLVKPYGYTGCPHQGGGGQGHIWLTGHDADYHCSQEGLQCHYLQVALTYVMNGSSLPVLALDHGTEVAAAISDAFGSSAPTVQTVDPRSGFASLPLVSSTGTPLYSAIVVASDITCGGCDNNNDFNDTPDSDAINARTSDIATFVNDGGGVLALAGADNFAVFYSFLPTSVTGASTTPSYTLTALGVSLGLIEDQDDNCCATHNSFQLPGSGSPLQVAETDAAGLAETLVAQGPFAFSAHRSTPTRSSKPPQEPKNNP